MAIENIDLMAEAIYQAKENGFDQAIFAGRIQTYKMRKDAFSANSTGRIRLIENGTRMEFLDLPVYRVDAEDYWRVS